MERTQERTAANQNTLAIHTGRTSNRQNKFERRIAMKYHKPINWNEVPDVITKEQFYRICHISKSTALYLLKSGAVPCEYSGRKTRCYKIKKDDVKKYLESKGKFPEYYSAPKGWYRGYRKVSLPTNMSDATLKLLHEYYADLLSDYKDVITSQEVVKLTGYAKSTITNWCGKGRLKHFIKHNTYYIPKVFLIEFFCSPYFRSIIRKTSWHIQTINEFHYLMQKEQS